VIDKVKTEGIKKTDLEASINQLDFRFRQYPEPQGLYRANAVFSSWLYGGDPALYLGTNEAIAKLRKMAENGEYELLAADVLGDVSMYSSIMLCPDMALEAKQAADEAARVKAELDKYGTDGYKELENLNDNLVKWQQTPDSDEDLSKIPMLALSDISVEPELIPTEEKRIDGMRLLYHKVPSNGIIYINAYFPITALSLEELPAAALISEFYKDLPTENYDVLSLQNEIRMHVGSISFGLDILAEDNDRSKCTPCIRARASVLEDKLSYAEDLLVEILTRTKFEDKALMKELIKQIDEDGKRAAVSSGHRLAMMEARSHWSSRDAAAEAVNGWTFLQYMHKMAEASDEDLSSFAAFAKQTVSECITKANVIMSETASEYADLSRFAKMLPAGEKLPDKAAYKSSLPTHMGIQIPAQVSFAVSAYDLAAGGFEMNGNMAVASNIISLAQLWNEIRVQGGSYGASMSVGRTGSLFCYTYRDPSPDRSLGIFKTTSAFIEGFGGASPDDIEGFIISSIANTEPLMSPAAKGRAADDFYLSGFTDDKRKRFRLEMLETKPEDLAAQKDVLAMMAEKACTCVVGPKTALEACDGLEIVEL
jgi:Zn-dependent M16 (insulinase) family peptidase